MLIYLLRKSNVCSRHTSTPQRVICEPSLITSCRESASLMWNQSSIGHQNTADIMIYDQTDVESHILQNIVENNNFE